MDFALVKEKINSSIQQSEHYISAAMVCEQLLEYSQAIVLYNKAVNGLEKALLFLITLKNDVPTIYDSTYNEVLKNIGIIKNKVDSLLNLNKSQYLVSNNVVKSQPALGVNKTTKLFEIIDGVKLYFVEQSEVVKSDAKIYSLIIYKIQNELTDNTAQSTNSPNTHYLQVGNWIYPLFTDITPVLNVNWCAYIFPDFMADTPGSFAGIIFLESVSEKERKDFEDLLSSLCSFRKKIQDTSLSKATQISQGIVKTANWLNYGLLKGAEITGDLINSAVKNIKENTEATKQNPNVDPQLKKGIEIVSYATQGAVGFTELLVSTISNVSNSLGQMIAPHIQNHHDKVLPTSWTLKDTNTGYSKFEEFYMILSSGIEGIGIVFAGLESSATILGKNISNGTVQLIEHKYGKNTGKVSEDFMCSLGNLALTMYYLENLKPKKIITQSLISSIKK